MGDVRSTLQAALGGAYQIERELGGGGMSRVFLATETALNRRVVVKELPSPVAAGFEVDRFQREIEIAAGMQHPHIVPLLTASATAAPLWYSMPYVEGQSLRARLSKDGELPIGDALRLLREVADALAYAHRHGIVHRDIKPENVLLSEGHAMVMDFGVAKAIAESTARAPSITASGIVLGTPAYMAPEQASGDPQMDHRADIYAFGVLSYEILTGALPFTGANALQVAHAHQLERAPAVSQRREGVPPPIDDLVARCLAKRPADRPQSAAELVAALDAVITSNGAESPVSFRAVLGRPWRRRRWAIAAGITLALAVGAIFVWRSVVPDTRARIVVAPFTNATGDSTYSRLSTEIATWVQDALINAAAFDVVDFRSLTTNTAETKAVVIGQGPAGVRALAEAAGAERVLIGSIHLLGDSLEFRASIVDPAQATVVLSVDPVRVATQSDPMRGLELLAQRAAGALATTTENVAKLAFVGAPHLPTITAYREFTAGVEAYQVADFEVAARHFKAALQADPEFHSSEVWLAAALGSFRSGVNSDSLGRLWHGLQQRRQHLSRLDQAWVDFVIARNEIQVARRIEAARRAAELWPDRWSSELMFSLSLAGRVREALEVAERIDPSKEYARGYRGFIRGVAGVYLMNGDRKGALRVVERAQRQSVDVFAATCWHAITLGVLGRMREADSLLAALPRSQMTPAYTEWRCRQDFADFVATLGPEELVQPTLHAWLKYLQSPEGTWPVRALQLRYVAVAAIGVRDTALARSALDSLIELNPLERVPRLFRAWLLATMGDRPGALAAEHEALDLPPAPFDRGNTERLRAFVAMALADRDGAVRLLGESVKAGYYVPSFYFAWVFRPLHGYPPFEALIDR